MDRSHLQFFQISWIEISKRYFNTRQGTAPTRALAKSIDETPATDYDERWTIYDKKGNDITSKLSEKDYQTILQAGHGGYSSEGVVDVNGMPYEFDKNDGIMRIPDGKPNTTLYLKPAGIVTSLHVM